MNATVSLWFLVVFGVVGSCLGQTNYTGPPLKVMFFQNAELSHPWAFAQEVARYENSQEFKYRVLTSVTDLYEIGSGETTFELVEKFMDDGYELFVFTASGWRDISHRLAKAYPEVNFVQYSGWNYTASDESLTNIVSVQGKQYHAYYLAGILAGYMSKTEKIGIMNGFPIPDTISAMNAYCIGARKVNDKIRCYTITLYSWVDDRKHIQASHQLLDFGCDHILAVTSSIHPSRIAAEEYEKGNTIFSVGKATDLRVNWGDTVSSSTVFFWRYINSQIIQSHLDGDFLYGLLQPGIDSGVIDAAPPSDLVPADAYPLFLYERERLRNASPGEELIFCGDAALDGIPDYVVPDETTGCLSAYEVGTMTYELAFMTQLEGEFYYNYVFVDSDDIAFIAMMVVISIVVVISFVYAILLIRYSRTPVIKMASPLFCFAIVIGGWLQFAAAYLYVQEPTDTNCMAPVWLEMIGFTIMLSAICVKNYRLYRLFKETKKFFPSVISNTELVVAMFFALMGMIAILIAFQVTHPYEPTTSSDSELDYDELYLYCYSDEEGLFIGLLWAYLSIWLLFACILSYLTRRLDGVFCESSQLALAIYNIIILEIIFLPLIYTFDRDQYEGRTILITLQPLYRGFATLSIIFLPKFWLSIMHPEKNTVNRTTSSKNSRVATSMMDD